MSTRFVSNASAVVSVWESVQFVILVSTVRPLANSLQHTKTPNISDYSSVKQSNIVEHSPDVGVKWNTLEFLGVNRSTYGS